MVVSRPSINFRTEQIVFSNAEMSPYVGFENLDELPDGWEYDIKRWCSLFDLRLPTMPRLADPSTQGISESTYFQSGVGSVSIGDLYIDKIAEMFIDNQRSWVPEIRHGEYFRWKTQHYLYSDNSRIQYLDTLENRDNRNYLLLDTEPEMTSPITAATYERNAKTKTPSYYTKIHQGADFTGLYSDGEELETVTDVGRILWDNVDTTKREFIVDNTIEGQTSLYFNKDYLTTHGVVPTVASDLAACEIPGQSDGSNYQVYKLKYFPVLADDSFHLYITDGIDFPEWEREDSWFDLINPLAGASKNKYFVDKDLGLVYFGSGQFGGAPPLGSFIVVAYSSTIRVEYEETEQENKISAIDADVNPITAHLNQGFVVITHDQLEAASILLEINKRKIPFRTPAQYGPVTIGSDSALLRATVKSAEGNPVPDQLVGFHMMPQNIGTLDGSSESGSLTDGLGQAYSSYQPPGNADTLGFYTTTVRSSATPGMKEVIIRDTDANISGRETELYIYQVLKDDILQGYDDIDGYIDNEIAENRLDYPPWATTPELKVDWRNEFKEKYNYMVEWGGQAELDATGKLSGRNVVIYKIDASGAGDKEGDNWDPAALNPIDGSSGAVVPLRPTLIEKIDDDGDIYNGFYKLLYPEDAIIDPEPDNSSNNVGGYWIVGARTVKFRASVFSQLYNRVIYSNELLVPLSLPTYMLGEYLTSAMEKIPYGWKLPTDTDSVASALDGATFITINPYGTYDQDLFTVPPTIADESYTLWGPSRIFNLINGTITDDWASAPFKGVGFQFKVTD